MTAISSKPDFPAIEKEILEKWHNEQTFRASCEKNQAESYVFYDGPPFANGMPHYGHLLTGYVKDIIPRYQTMLGKQVERRFGWDCHGLPAELEAEKELGISGKLDIEKLGIEKFNNTCRSSVMKYADAWRSIVSRQGRWVDFDNDYKTMDISYMESVIWAFKELYKKGLIYEGYRVMPYSFAVESPLSNFETRLDNSYRMRQDPALTVAFNLKNFSHEGLSTVKILAWTTTPWTLPSNLALAASCKIEYVLFTKQVSEEGSACTLGYIASKGFANTQKGIKILASIPGEQLIGLQYESIFGYFETHGIFDGTNFVLDTDGTGVVHMAPGFGEDDFDLCAKHGVKPVCPVDSKGCFTNEVPDYQGINVIEANREIIKDLKERGPVFTQGNVVYKHETIDHNYPHCWRTDEPLIYKAISSWYVAVSQFKDRAVELNQQINWIPEHVKDGQFGNWLKNARDWSISRTRYWGTPIPVWKSDDPKYPRIDIYGSIAELEADFGAEVTDLHRPFIDTLVRPNPDDPTGKSMMRRVPEVFDCWFESGAMPFAQQHYPFENKEKFEKNFPADFIVEYIAQTRGWFYTLMVLSTALFDRPPFLNCICHGVVLDENKKKLSKRLRNYVDPTEVFEAIGSDGLRWFLVSSAVLRGGDLLIPRTAEGMKEIYKRVLSPLWSACYFYELYRETDDVKPCEINEPEDLLNRYILAKMRHLQDEVIGGMDDYNVAAATKRIEEFFDILNNWYIRRSRDRFWGSGLDNLKLECFNTLYTVLKNLLELTAPLLPFLTDYLYRKLITDESTSVHLQALTKLQITDTDTSTIDDAYAICKAGLSLREKAKKRIRLPLRTAIILGRKSDDILTTLIQEELNVKEVHYESAIGKYAEFTASLDVRNLGPKYGAKFKEILAHVKSADYEWQSDGSIKVAGELVSNEYVSKVLTIKKDSGENLVGDTAGEGIVLLLNVEDDVELEQEGQIRDLIRQVQNQRKEDGLNVSDRILLQFTCASDIQELITKYKDQIETATLAQIHFGSDYTRELIKLDVGDINYTIAKI